MVNSVSQRFGESCAGGSPAGSFLGGVVSSLVALRSLVAGDPLYGDAPTCVVELIDLFNNVFENVLPR